MWEQLRSHKMNVQTDRFSLNLAWSPFFPWQSIKLQKNYQDVLGHVIWILLFPWCSYTLQNLDNMHWVKSWETFSKNLSKSINKYGRSCIHKKWINKRAMMALNRSPESVSPQNEFYLLYYYCSKLWPPGWGRFWPQGYHMNRIDIGPNIIVQGQMIKALLLLVPEKKNFKVFLLCSYVSNLWPRGGAQFDPRGIIWTTLVEVH